MLQCINEVFAELMFYNVINFRLRSGTISLVTGQGEYELDTTFTGFYQEYLYDQTNDNYIYQFPGTYKQFLDYKYTDSSGTTQNQPLYYIATDLGKQLDEGNAWSSHHGLEVYPLPDSSYNGDSYTYWYRESAIYDDNASNEPYYTSATTSTTVLPVSDSAAHMLVPAIAEKWSMKRKQTFDAGAYNAAMALATRAILPYDHQTAY